MKKIIWIIILILIDQASKYFVVEHLKGQDPKIIIKNFFQLQYVENRGAAFGIMQDKRWLFILITLIVVAIILYVLFLNKSSLSSLVTISLVLILSGTIGNFIDRLRLHYVVDFLSFRFFGHNFAVFNLADAFIVIGTLVLMLWIIMLEGTSE